MKTKLIVTGMLLGSAFLITNAFAQESKLPLANTEWALTAVDGKMASGASLNFKEKELFGKFCNHFSTSYEEKNGILKTEVIAVTQMLCQGDMMQYETHFAPEGAKLELSEKNLKLTQTNGHTYEWKKIEAEKKSHFDKGGWKLVAFNGKTAVTGATLSFSGDWLSAKFCNRISGNYEPRGGKIKSEGLMTTLMLCQGELGDYEMAFTLKDASYEITKEGKLLITTTKGDRFLWEKVDEKLENTTMDQKNQDQQALVHKILDDYFQKNAKAFPTAKEKTVLLSQIKKIFVEAIEKADPAMKESYRNFLKLIENYRVK